MTFFWSYRYFSGFSQYFSEFQVFFLIMLEYLSDFSYFSYFANFPKQFFLRIFSIFPDFQETKPLDYFSEFWVFLVLPENVRILDPRIPLFFPTMNRLLHVDIDLGEPSNNFFGKTWYFVPTGLIPPPTPEVGTPK